MTTDRHGRDINVEAGKQGFQERARATADLSLDQSGFGADDGGLIGNGPDGAETFSHDGKTFAPLSAEQTLQETNVNGMVVKTGVIGDNLVTETYDVAGVLASRFDSPTAFAQSHDEAVIGASNVGPDLSIKTPTDAQRLVMLGSSETIEAALGAPDITREDDAVGEVYTTTRNAGHYDEVTVKNAVREFDGMEYNVSNVRMGRVSDDDSIEFSTMLRVDSDHLDQAMMRSLHDVMAGSYMLS